MVRRLTLVLMLTALLIPGGAFALGLGEIHLKSALNQAFDADIDLLSVKADELDGVKVSLASPEAFERAGVDRLFILTKLRYQADLNDQGQPVIRVTSRQAIREPFLNFLIEVNWAKGRLVREYTVLLDPPVTLDRKPAPVSVPVTAAPAPMTSVQQPSAPVQLQQAKPAEAVAPQAGVTEYGPVMANETLWPIALKLKPQGVTVKQMMIALQRKNPHAFIRQNVNNLKRGSILRIPTQEEIDLISAREARTEFSNQVAEWKAYQAASAGAVADSAEAAISSSEPPAPDSELKLASVRPEGEGKGGVSEGDGSEEITSKLENELILAREQFESAKQERNDLNSQVSQLESQLADLESLLAVRNEQLARLQNELKQSQAGTAQATTEAPTIETAAEVKSETTEIALDATDETEELEIVDTEQESKPAEEEAQGKTEITEVAPPTPQATPAPAPQAQVPASAPTESILDTLKGLLKDNMIAAAGGGLVILLLLLLLARRSRAESEEFEESILVGTQSEDTESLGTAAGADTEGMMSEAAETSFLSEFSHSDMDVLQDDTGEVDPVAEADVYIAYGRYQQAEELLQQAIARDPDHTKSYFKLLEILFVTKNAKAFTEVAETLATKNPEQADVDAWQQVLAMGHQLSPEHELFANVSEDVVVPDYEQPTETASEEASETGAAEETAEEAEDLDFMELSDLTADFDSGDEGAEEEGTISSLLEDDSLDFDLNLGLDAEEEAPALSEETDVDDELLNADVGDIPSDVGLDDALADISTEQPDSSISALDVETETSELEESLSLDDLDLGDPFEADALEEEETEQTDEAAELLGGSEDLAAALSSFTDEPLSEATPDEASEDQGLSLGDETLAADDFGDLGAELEGLTADLTAEEGGTTLGDELEELSGADDSFSLDELTEDESSASPDAELEADELMLGDLEQEVSKLEDIGDRDDLLADVSLDDLELDELSSPESDSTQSLDAEADLPDLSDEDLMIEGDLDVDSSMTMDEPLSEMLEEPDKIDEINTKLDLARAYVEMGDEEGARNILDEVLNEGDDVQKQDAQELLNRLS